MPGCVTFSHIFNLSDIFFLTEDKANNHLYVARLLLRLNEPVVTNGTTRCLAHGSHEQMVVSPAQPPLPTTQAPQGRCGRLGGWIGMLFSAWHQGLTSLLAPRSPQPQLPPFWTHLPPYQAQNIPVTLHPICRLGFTPLPP